MAPPLKLSVRFVTNQRYRKFTRLRAKAVLNVSDSTSLPPNQCPASVPTLNPNVSPTPTASSGIVHTSRPLRAAPCASINLSRRQGFYPSQSPPGLGGQLDLAFLKLRFLILATTSIPIVHPIPPNISLVEEED